MGLALRSVYGLARAQGLGIPLHVGRFWQLWDATQVVKVYSHPEVRNPPLIELYPSQQ